MTRRGALVAIAAVLAHTGLNLTLLTTGATWGGWVVVQVTATIATLAVMAKAAALCPSERGA